EMGSYGESEAAFQRVLAADPENREAMRGLGNIYIATDQPTKAIEQFQRLIERKPTYQAFNGLGVAYDLEGKHAAAQKAYHSGLAENPTSLTLKNNLALSLALSGDYPAAIDLLRSVSRHPQATYRHRQNLALVYGLAGDMTHAAEIARIDLDPKAVQSNLEYYAWLRSQPKLSPSDVMRYSGPEGKGGVKTPAIEQGTLPAEKAGIDIGATASLEPVAGAGSTIAAAPRIPVVGGSDDDADEADEAEMAMDADTGEDGAPGDYVLLPEERAARMGRVFEVAHTVPQPAPRPTMHFRDMTFAQFARAVGIYGPACADTYDSKAPAVADGPAGAPAIETPAIDPSQPVMAAVAASVTQPIERVEQVAYRIDSTITLEGLRRY
ncbi:MAG TPA: tetratricopeptide repeat protein, partial [Alphaproteobacteria bacterium]